MKNKVQGEVMQVLVGTNPRAVEDDPLALVTTPCAHVRVTLEGFEGDKHAGIEYLSSSRTLHYPRGTVIRNTRQISIVSLEDLDLIAVAMGVPKILPPWLGANLAFRGIPDLTHLPPSTRLFFPNDAVLVVEGENKPCVFPGKVIAAQYPALSISAALFPKAGINRRGVVAWVERPGMIGLGEQVVAEIPRQALYSVPTNRKRATAGMGEIAGRAQALADDDA